MNRSRSVGEPASGDVSSLLRAWSDGDQRALALAGDTAKAKSAYGELLTLWKNADAQIPVVEQARTEYARLP